MIIAIIDDDPIFQFLTRKLIEKLAPDHPIIRFNDGQQALDFVQSNWLLPKALPALMLLDINMPKLNGWQFLDGLRSLGASPYRPVIYLASSSTDQDDVLRAQTYTELKGFLHKPLSVPQLSALLREQEQGPLVDEDESRA